MLICFNSLEEVFEEEFLILQIDMEKQMITT